MNRLHPGGGRPVKLQPDRPISQTLHDLKSLPAGARYIYLDDKGVMFGSAEPPSTAHEKYKDQLAQRLAGGVIAEMRTSKKWRNAPREQLESLANAALAAVFDGEEHTSRSRLERLNRAANLLSRDADGQFAKAGDTKAAQRLVSAALARHAEPPPPRKIPCRSACQCVGSALSGLGSAGLWVAGAILAVPGAALSIPGRVYAKTTDRAFFIGAKFAQMELHRFPELSERNRIKGSQYKPSEVGVFFDKLFSGEYNFARVQSDFEAVQWAIRQNEDCALVGAAAAVKAMDVLSGSYKWQAVAEMTLNLPPEVLSDIFLDDEQFQLLGAGAAQAQDPGNEINQGTTRHYARMLNTLTGVPLREARPDSRRHWASQLAILANNSKDVEYLHMRLAALSEDELLELFDGKEYDVPDLIEAFKASPDATPLLSGGAEPAAAVEPSAPQERAGDSKGRIKRRDQSDVSSPVVDAGPVSKESKGDLRILGPQRFKGHKPKPGTHFHARDNRARRKRRLDEMGLRLHKRYNHKVAVEMLRARREQSARKARISQGAW